MQRASYPIRWHDGPRGPLRHLFALAEDSPLALDRYMDLGRLLVARDERDGSIVGHLQLVRTGPHALEIKSLAVREGLRRKGVGRRLVERAVEAARAEGARTVWAMTATADLDNLRFYQRCGFRPASVERDAFTPERGYAPDLAVDGVPVRDAIRLELALDDGS